MHVAAQSLTMPLTPTTMLLTVVCIFNYEAAIAD